MTKEEGQKENFAGMNGDVEGDGEKQATDVPGQVEEIPDTSEEQAAPARVSGGTDEENGEELEPVSSEPQPAAGEEGKAQGAGNGHEEVFLFLCLLVCPQEYVCVCALQELLKHI